MCLAEIPPPPFLICVTVKIPLEGALVKQEARLNPILTFSFFSLRGEKDSLSLFSYLDRSIMKRLQETVNTSHGRNL